MGTISDKLNKLVESKAAIKAAIEAKGVSGVGDVLSMYASKIASIKTDGGSTGYTGHADAEGLKAIGWTDDDIAYYQAHGVNWNEEDDEYHKVPQDNIDLYGVLTADNIQTYKDIIVYLPKIDLGEKTDLLNFLKDCKALISIPLLDTSSVTSMNYMFSGCYSLVSIPFLDTSNVTDMYNMFSYCYSLVYIPLLDTSSVTNMSGMFSGCYSLVSIPFLDTSNVTDMYNMFYSCYRLTSIPLLDTSKVTNMGNMFNYCRALVSIPRLDTSHTTRMGHMFSDCCSLSYIPLLDTSNVTDMGFIIYNCYSLNHINIKNLKLSLTVEKTSLLSKKSLLYIIENAAPTSPITITLSAYCYKKYKDDSDVVAALEKQPNISLASV